MGLNVGRVKKKHAWLALYEDQCSWLNLGTMLTWLGSLSGDVLIQTEGKKRG